MENNKMNWLKEQYINNKIAYVLHNTGEKKGTAVLPTGAGKSGIMYSDAIWHIDHMKDSEKLILHFSAPILKLNVQMVNDFVDVISQTHKGMCESGKLMFFINSSADGDSYDIEGLYADVNRFNEINKFFENKNANIAIVVSCFRSIHKFAEKIDYLKSMAKVVTYIDEAHLVINDTRDDTEYDKLNKEGKERWNSLKKICKSDYIYALTATPDKYVVDIINSENGKTGRSRYSYIYEERASDLINNNIILPVKAFTSAVSSLKSGYKITEEHCMRFMETVKEQNPNIKHKVLVTCENSDHLNYLCDNLGEFYKVFSTCAKNGTNYTQDGEMIDIDETKFIKEVDDFDEDCFVLHIRQLRQGIDIKSLTDCIYYNSTRVNDGVKRTILQTIGRCLRPAIGERGMSKDKRTKIVGNVLFVIGQDDYETVQRQMINLIIKYYGGNGVEVFSNDISRDYGKTGKNKGKFTFGNGGFGDEYYDYIEVTIEELKANIIEFTKNTIKPMYDLHVRLNGGKTSNKLVPMIIVKMKAKFQAFCEERCLDEILTEKELLDYFHEALIQFGVEQVEAKCEQ